MVVQFINDEGTLAEIQVQDVSDFITVLRKVDFISVDCEEYMVEDVEMIIDDEKPRISILVK